MPKRTYILCLFLFQTPFWMRAQDGFVQDSSNLDVEIPQKKFILNGYIKTMQFLNFSKEFDNLNSTNLLHNRINSKWMPTQNLTISLELRNRILWGDEIRTTPNYDQYLRNSNEAINLSNIWYSNTSMVLHTNIDRLHVEYRYKNINLKLGRQRINWGITSIWNPNDVFNTFNFLDFDYEERPGSDAIKVSTEFSSFSGLELAFSSGNSSKGKVVAGKYYFNTKGYDIQIISGVFKDRFTLGLGWAGNIGDAGFKGETQIFSRTIAKNIQYNFCIEGDYAFSNGWYLNGSFLYNNSGMESKIIQPLELNFNFSPSNLMPTKYNFAIMAKKEINPLFSSNLTVMYAPGTNLLLLLPGLTYSLSDNLAADLVWQSFSRT